MELICNGHKDCKLRKGCTHSKIHEKIIDTSADYGECINRTTSDLKFEDCYCTEREVRKLKLEKIEKI